MVGEYGFWIDGSGEGKESIRKESKENKLGKQELRRQGSEGGGGIEVVASRTKKIGRAHV